MLINEYNRGIDHSNSLRSSLYTSRGISFGAIATLLTAFFTQTIIVFWYYIFLPLIFVVIYLIIVQVKINDQIEKTNYFCNYIQVILKNINVQANSDKLFVPFSYVFNSIKKSDYSLKECLNQFNNANIEDYLVEHRKIPRKTNWVIIFQISLIIVISAIVIIILVYMIITGIQPKGVPSEFFDFLQWFILFSLLGVGIAGINYLAIDYILYKKKKASNTKG